MKKLLVLFAMCIALMACTGNSTKPAETTIDTDTVVVVDSVDSLADSIN